MIMGDGLERRRGAHTPNAIGGVADWMLPLRVCNRREICQKAPTASRSTGALGGVEAGHFVPAELSGGVVTGWSATLCRLGSISLDRGWREGIHG